MNTAWISMQGPLVKGAISTGLLVFAFFFTILILAVISYILHQFFSKHEGIKNVHQFMIYLLTMAGVVVLLVGGLLGLVIPIIPGVLLIFLALLLLRRYYRNAWMDKNIEKLTWRLRLKQRVQKARKTIRRRVRKRREKIGKALKRRGMQRTKR